MMTASSEPSRSEPTVFGAIRRYRAMVIAIVVAAVVAAIAYTQLKGPTYRASASLTEGLPAQNQDSAQYLDSQVLLLQSQNVAREAAVIANRSLGDGNLAVGNFYGDTSWLTITPPEAAAQGVYGASIVSVQFTAPSARVAQAGANAILQAFDNARNASLRAQANATIAGIDNAIANSTASQRSALEGQ